MQLMQMVLDIDENACKDGRPCSGDAYAVRMPALLMMVIISVELAPPVHFLLSKNLLSQCQPQKKAANEN